MKVLSQEEYLQYKKEKKQKGIQEKIKSGVALTQEEYREYKGLSPIVEEEEEEQKKSNTDKWFKAGAFEDGYQLGDLTKTIAGTVGDATVNVGKGVLGLVEGVTDLVQYGAMGVTSLFDKEKAQKIKQSAMESWTDNLLGGLEKKADKYSVLGDKSDNIAQGIGYIGGILATGGIAGATAGASAGASALIPTLATTGVTFASSMGGGMGEAYQSGADDMDATTYGLIKGVSDSVSELIFGGLGKAVGAVGLSTGLSSLDDVLAQKISSKVTNQVAKNVIQFGVKASAEGLEEVIAGVGSAIGKQVTYMEDEEWSKIIADEKLLDQFIAGAITSGFAQSGYVPGMTQGSLREANKTGRDFISGYTQNEQSVLDQVTQQEIQRQEQESGKSLTKKEQNAIKKDIETMLKRGEIDTDTIEKTFGGESYTAYDSLRKESDEYKKLADTPLEKLSLNEQKRRDELDAKNTEKSYSDRLLEAQGKLSETVNKATENDMYLRESFAEKGRRGEVFKLSEEEKKSFTAEEMKIVNKAIESGDINNTRKAHDMVSFVAKLSAQTKTDFDFTNNKKLAEAGYIVEGKTIDGFKEGNKIAVNLQSKKALNTVVGHEITHVLEGTDLYTALQSTLKEYATTKGVYDSLFDKAKENYKNVYKGLTEAEYNKKIEQEVTADLVGDYIFSDMDFVRNLSTKNPNVFQKVFNEIKYMLKVATAGSDAEKQLLKAKKIFEDVYRDTKRNASEDVQYDVSESAEVIELSKDSELVKQIENVHGSKRYKMIQEYILGALSEQPIRLSDGKNAVVDRSDALHMANKSANRKTAEISKIKEIVEKAKLYAEDTNAEHNKFDYFCYYRADVKLGEKTYPLYLNVGRAKNDGKYHVYDITKNIKDVANRINGLERPTNNEGYALQDDISKDIVPNDSNKSSGKTQFSVSDNASIEDKINSSMTMKEAKDMLTRVYNAVDIRGYRNADEWLQDVGSGDVAMTLESDYASYKKYIEGNEDILNEEYTIEDVLDAYSNGTLVGKQKESSVRLDTSKDTGFVDNRFYAPQDIKGGQDLYNIASQRVTNSNKAEVYKARADFIINAHNNGYIESLGLTREEVNKKLKSWANYTPKAMNLSNSLNEGVATQNRWTGIENSTILNTISVTDEELGKLVKSIDGNSSEWQRQYITSTMLALDTHIDYKGLSFVFDGSGMSSDTALGQYVDSEQTIYIRRAGQNTVAHEMGHYLDHLWGRDLGYNGADGLTGRGVRLENLNAEQRQFVKNFYAFLNDIENSSDIGSSYKQSANEVFARFVARFTEWTKNQATNNRYGYEDKWYKDNFTERQYREFVKLLQEKAMLDTTSTQYALSDTNQDIAPMPNGIYGKDVMLDIAPIREDVAKTDAIAPDVTGMTTRMRQEEIEMQNEMFPPMAEEDAHNMLDSDEDWDRLRKMQEAVEPQEDIDDTVYPMSDTARLSEADLREVRKSIKDKLPLQRGRTKEFNDIVQRYSTSEYPNLDALFYEIKDNFGKITVEQEIEDVAEVQNILKQTRINVSDNIKKGVTDYVQTMRRNSFKMRFSKDGLPVDVAYQELSEMYPNMFPEDITNEVDQFEQLVSVANMMRKETGEFEIDDYTIGETVNSIVNTVRDIRTRHNQNTAERRARWFDKDTTLEEYMQTDDFAELEGNPNLLRVFQERWDRNRLTTEPQIDETTAQILDSEPQVHKKGFKENLKRKWAVFKANFVDKGAVFEDLSKVTKNRQLEAKWDYTMLSDAQAQNFMQNGDEGSKSLESIREEVDNTGFSKEFSEYMYHYLNIDRMTLDARYGIENKTVFGQTVTADVSKQKVSELESAHPEFKAFAQDVYTYMNELRGRLVKNGVISQETADLWSEMYPHYVPIRRVDSKGLDVNVPLATNRTGVNAPIKKATGGNSDILPLFDTMAQRTMQTFKAINKNDFGIELKNTLGSTIGVENSSIDGAIDMVESQDALLKAGENGYNPTFTVFEDGKRVTFEITQEMYEALLPMSERLRDSGSKILQTASSIHRGVLTQYNPVFALTNGLKDAQDILINSQHPLKTYVKVPEATQQLLNKGKWYQEYMKQGGGDNSYFDTDTNTIAPVRKGISKVLDTFPLKQINNLNEFIERVPRLAEYIASREMGRSVQESMLDASRVTTNFKAGGDVTKFLNRNGATFLNASVQGVTQQVRNIREAKMNGLKGWGMLATKFAIAGLPALLLNHLIWGDDEEYEELSDYVKQNYYVVGKTEDGHFIRIPKGRTVAVIQEAVNQVDKLATGDDSADLNTFLEVLANNLAPNNPISNNVLAPIIQASTNKTWYGEDLVPQNLQDLPSAEQYDESTDSISKAIGETFNISPMKVNYLLDQYTGLVGDMILPALTPEVTSDTDSPLGYAIAPLKDKFTTDGVMNKQVITDFYDKSDELTTNANKSNATSEDILRNKYLNSVKAEMNDLYKQKREIQNSDLTNKEKYAQVREIQSQISALAQEGMSNYENAEVYDYYGKVNDRHFHLNDDGEWQKITDKQLAKQGEVTSALGITANDYWSSKEEYDYMYEQPGRYGIAKAIGGYETYKAINKSLYEIKADKDIAGRTINNSRKAKVVEYLNNLDADYYTKILMYKAEYTSDDRYNREIINYLNEREDISYQEMADILTELGFKVTADGRIIW